MIDWGDGIVESGNVAERSLGPPDSISGGNGTVAGSHVYADNGIYTVTVIVTDDEGTSDSDMLIATVNNVAPTTTLAGVTTFEEGSAFTLTLELKNDPDEDTVSAQTLLA